MIHTTGRSEEKQHAPIDNGSNPPYKHITEKLQETVRRRFQEYPLKVKVLKQLKKFSHAFYGEKGNEYGGKDKICRP